MNIKAKIVRKCLTGLFAKTFCDMASVAQKV